MSTNKLKKKDRRDLIQYINLQLASLGQPLFINNEDDKLKLSDAKFLALTDGLIKSFKEKNRQLAGHLSPADSRIQQFLNDYLKDVKIDKECKIPSQTFVLNQKGIAREISLPPNGDKFESELLTSYRLKQGILNNPAKDKRTTEGTFHIVEGGLPVPPDKKEVPKVTFAHMFNAAFSPSDELNTLPFTSTQEDKARIMVSLLMRPIVCPEIKGVIKEKSMEIRFFAPGNLVSNLDFVENIFGNAGDHNLAENDSALDVEHWTGHTGCIVLAPQLTKLKKKDVGLPHISKATPRQKNDGMCWEKEDELYNNGVAFKLTCRDSRGIVITLVADNYYGYSKKEIKTQISYSANLYGLVEEEHAGGAIAYPRGNMGDKMFGYYHSEKYNNKYSFAEAMDFLGNRVTVFPENYAVDNEYPNIIYIPENANMDTNTGTVCWNIASNKAFSLKISPSNYYVYPTGHKLKLERHPTEQLWHLIDTAPEGVFCHKPSTVSGGGKSEISKSMENAIRYGSFYIQNLEKDCQMAEQLINFDYSNRWKDDSLNTGKSRSLLSPKRTLGSAVKLLTPSDEYTDQYNDFLKSIPFHVRTLALYIKRLHRGYADTEDWKGKLHVEIVNGRQGNALMYKHNKVTASYVRIGFDPNGLWYLHRLRSDFIPSQKIQMEDDISATITIPSYLLGNNLNPDFNYKSVKLVTNCESHFFQRPDEAIHRGYDKDAEFDIVQKNTFLTNYEPLKKSDARNILDDAISFDSYTEPVKKMIRSVAESEEDIYFVTPSHTRLVDGEPTKNPRYLQKNIFKDKNIDTHLAEIGVRLYRKIQKNDEVYFPIDAVLSGRRNNPADKKSGIRALSVYNPIHYQELPELFMDYICSLTGKSPSTTGAGSEGALTKGPFNMLTATTDLNNALLSFIMTQYNGFSTAAGYIGNENRFDHDISILVPEIWARMEPMDRDPKVLIDTHCLEKLEDFEYNGNKVLASRLGYRITSNFAFRCMNKLFDEPLAVFNERMLRPELQSIDEYVDGINNIVEAQQKVALSYFEDGSIESAIPPLKILLHVMAYGHYEGKEISDPGLRAFFDRENVLNSDWYNARLQAKQDTEVAFHTDRLKYLQEFVKIPTNKELVEKLHIHDRISFVKTRLEYVSSKTYLNDLKGTIGLDPLYQ